MVKLIEFFYKLKGLRIVTVKIDAELEKQEKQLFKEYEQIFSKISKEDYMAWFNAHWEFMTKWNKMTTDSCLGRK